MHWYCTKKSHIVVCGEFLKICEPSIFCWSAAACLPTVRPGCSMPSYALSLSHHRIYFRVTKTIYPMHHGVSCFLYLSLLFSSLQGVNQEIPSTISLNKQNL